MDFSKREPLVYFDITNECMGDKPDFADLLIFGSITPPPYRTYGGVG
jgi:hypothetical protein